MRIKGISSLALCLAALLQAGALEERITLLPGESSPSASRVGAWSAQKAILRKGFKGRSDYVMADEAYGSDTGADLLVHFDGELPARDETGRWGLEAGRAFSVNRGLAAFGPGSASFRGPDSALAIEPGPDSLFSANSSFRDFSVEFWLYPANVDNGEVIFLWQSLRKLPSSVMPQSISCVVAEGRLYWSFSGFFGSLLEGSSTRASSAPKRDLAPSAKSVSRVELRGREPLVPRRWSHHLLRFDGDTGLLEYLVDGQSAGIAYTTASGHEGGTVLEPMVGAASPIKFCPEYAGLADELRISRFFVEEPSLKPFGRASSLVETPVTDLGFGNSRLFQIDAEYRTPGNASVEFSYRIADSWASWQPLESDVAASWIPFRPGERLSASARGRYVQVRAELFADGGGKLSPALSSVSLRFEADPPPPPPAKLLAYAKDGALELHWTRVPEADLAGYLVYYGDRPGEYFGVGADQGPSPIDVGNTTTLSLTGIANGRLLYFAVAAYDSGPDPDDSTGAASRRAESRAGESSEEVSARPSRTAQ